MRYMLFIKHPDNVDVSQVPPSLLEAMGGLVTSGMKSGVIIDTAGLQPTSAGKRVTLRGGKIAVKDGPFAEAKEVVGGYALVELDSTDQAVDFAKQFMELHRVHWPSFEGECEVRPLESMG